MVQEDIPPKKRTIKRCSTPSFIAEFPLRTNSEIERELSIRLDAGRQIYNAALGEGLRRLDLMRQSKRWAAARGMPKTINGKANKSRGDAFKSLANEFEFHWVALIRFTQKCRNECWIKDHLGSQEAQALTKRAFKSIEKYLYEKRDPSKKSKAPIHGMPAKGRPRFKRFDEFDSVENQCNTNGLRFHDGAIKWFDLTIPIMRDPRDVDGYQDEALTRRVKYCRVLRKKIRGKIRWYAQLILEGEAPQRRLIGDGSVGLDIGPSTIAAVSDHSATLEKFCPTITQPWRELRRIERAMDRSRRATNPDAFNSDGTWKSGKRKKINRSVRYQKLAMERRERERKIASERKRAHGELANRILGQGRDVHTEKLSYKAFQKQFGRSVKVRAPGMFVAMLQRKGAVLTNINTRKTALSQFDHTTGEFIKKPLSQRTHYFGDGKTDPVQRDLYSAFLARHCEQETLNVRQAAMAWPGAEPLLRRAMLSAKQSTSGGFGLPHALRRVRVDRPLKVDCRSDEASDVVPTGRAAESLATSTTKTTQGVSP